MAGDRPSERRLVLAGQYGVYLLFRAVELIMRMLPLVLCARIGQCLGFLAYFLDRRHRLMAQHNLTIAFGREKEKAWIKKTAQTHFQNLGSNLMCSLKLPLMEESEIIKRVTTEGMEHPAALVAQGKPLLCAVSHMGCWELLTQCPSLYLFGLKPASIYQPLANPFLDAHVKSRREKLNYTLFDRNDGFSGPMKHLREDRGVLGVLVDQHAGDKGVWSPFFDRLSSTTSLPALMAIRCDTPLLPLSIYNDGIARWKLIFSPPVVSSEKKPTAEGLTAALNLAVEKVIRRAPENWFWVHNRWKTPCPDFLLGNTRRGIVLPLGYPSRQLQPFELLVRSPNWLGDACMAMPAVRALKTGRPDIRVTVLVPAKLRELWEALPEVDAVITKDKNDSVLKVARRIRETTRFDVAILFTNSTRSTLELWCAGIPRLVGYRGSLRSRLLHQMAPDAPTNLPPEHHANKYLRLVHCCGIRTDKASLLPSDTRITTAEEIRIGLCAGAEYGAAKRWPLERFAGVASRFSANHPHIEWLLFGAPGEKTMGEDLSCRLGDTRHRNLVGATSLTELIALLRSCRLLLTNDTGTMHLAAALGVPTVSIFGSTEPILTGPLGNHHIMVRHHVPCSPCFKRECPFGHYDCMTGVTVERVVAEVQKMLTTSAEPA